MDGRYKELSDRAFKLHKNNEFEEAEKIYTLLLQINPNDINILNLYGLLCIVQGRYNDAIRYLSKAAIFKPTAYISGNLAKAYFEAGQTENAINIFSKIAQEEPTDDILYSLGIAYKKAGNYNKSISSYLNAIEINPNHFSSLYNLANTYKELDKNYLSKKYALRAVELKPDSETVHSLLSDIYADENDFVSALNELKICIMLNNKNYLYYYNAGIYYSKINDKELAQKYYIAALRINPCHISSIINLASLYKEANNEECVKLLESAYKISPKDETVCLLLAQVYRDFYYNDKSLRLLRKTVKNNADCAEAYALIGTNYMDYGKYRTALKYYEKALELNPNNINYKHSKASALKYMGKINEAEKIFTEISKNPNVPLKSKLSLAMIYLQKKDFEKGMSLYGLRYLETKMRESLKEKIWNKSTEISDKKVLVYSNCGLGDTIMFCRYLPFLKETGSEIALQTDNELIDILKINYPDIPVYKKSKDIEDFDTILQIMDSAYALNMDFNNIPFAEGYLKADSNKIKSFKKLEIFNTKKLKAGVFYQGNKRIFRNRALSYKYIEELAQLKGVQVYSFQIENNENETDNIINLSSYIKDYSDTAALLNCIDLLITIDSSIVHMAGALGVKTKLLIPQTAEWRWFDDTKTTPWYNSVEIIRQTKSFDWSKEIEIIKSELDEYKR